DIGALIRANQLGLELTTIRKGDQNAVRTFYNVVIGEYVAILRNEETRTQTPGYRALFALGGRARPPTGALQTRRQHVGAKEPPEQLVRVAPTARATPRDAN